MSARRVGVYAGLMLVTVAAGLLVRFAPLGQPWVLRKYGGSALWAVMIYWVISAALPSHQPRRLTIGSGVVATLLELSRQWHVPALDAFRETTAGVLLLGKYFSLWNILVYWLAIAAAALLDATVLRPVAEGGSRSSGRC